MCVVEGREDVLLYLLGLEARVEVQEIEKVNSKPLGKH